MKLKKFLNPAAVIVIITVVIIISMAIYFFTGSQSSEPASEERISYGNDKIIESIDRQLQGIDVNRVKSKDQYIEQKSISQLKEALRNKNITCQELVAYYLLNIKEHDQNATGSNAVSEINPDAMKAARSFDETYDNRALAGIPILVKENINTDNMPTSGGTIALKDFIPEKNAPVINRLIDNGAIILGKTNLSEMSNYMSTDAPSGYSSKKGQTLNPFNPLVLSPLGSSSGSAVAMAMDFAASSLGTETAGSIVAPASINSVVGFKPSNGNIDGKGIIPISYGLDSVGPISRSVMDALITYNGAAEKKISENLDKDAIRGKKIGIVRTDETFDKALEKKLKEIGASVVFVNIDFSSIDAGFLMKNDFQKDLNSYLQANNAPVKSLKELIAYNKKDKERRMKYGQNYLSEAVSVKPDKKKAEEIVKYAKNMLKKAIDENDVELLVSENNSAAALVAAAGAPELTVPFGIVGGTPVGATFFSKAGEDEKVIGIGFSFEQLTGLRKIPGVDKLN